VNPSHAEPASIEARWAGKVSRLGVKPVRALLSNLRAILHESDPDLILTSWGDTWMLARLYDLAREAGQTLSLNRDPARGLLRRKERSYQAYGQVIHRGQQVHLFGRLHIDRCNAMMWGDYGLEGVLELSRVTSLPMQVAARVSPGTGISSMQILTALSDQTLVPWHKQQAEDLRPARDLFYADQGGLVYQPRVGLHFNVGEIDFISMYPSVMYHFNISPETLGPNRPGAVPVPELGLAIDNSQLGLVPRTLKPLLDKRVELKTQLLTLPKWHPRRKHYQACAQAHKWLLVTCFGYLGYKNARFGRIEAHQAVTAYGREALLRAKEAAEEQGFEVLHLYVDGMWAVRPGASQVPDFQPLLDGIVDRTGLPISLDGIFRWVAFLPSRRDDRVPVANRYFGVFQDGEIKVRGIEARRLDTPPFIYRTQMDMLEILAEAVSPTELHARLPRVMDRLQRALDDVRLVRLPLADYLVTLRVSRTLEEFRTPSPTARALAQLRKEGKELRPGQRVRFLHLRGEPKVWAWDLPGEPARSALDTGRYRTLLLRAAGTILQPFGIPEVSLAEWAASKAVSIPLPGKSLQLALR
jgi:DNA polymerase-2